MFFSRMVRTLAIAVVGILGITSPGLAERIDRGSQVIKGTSVNTSIYHERGYAVFENSCGSQRLTQRELQNGATPDNIIPCPRPRAAEPRAIPETPRGTERTGTLWGAMAAGLDERSLFGRGRVSVGTALNHSSETNARNAALAACRENGVQSCKVTGTFTGCGYATTSTNGSSPLVWTTGSDRQEVYQRCYDKVRTGNCNHPAIGGCNRN